MFKFVLILCVLLVPVGALFFGTRGCESVFPHDAGYTESEDPDFLRGRELVSSGRDAEAMTVFQEIIRRYPNDAPESNMEAGLIAFRRSNFPLAIYHFTQYLSLRPDAAAASQKRARDLIDSSKKGFFEEILPLRGAGSESVSDGLSVELQRKYQDVMRQNEQLKSEIAALRRQLDAAGTSRTPGNTVPVTAVPESEPIVAQPVVVEPPAEPVRPPVPATHTVVAGDTLSAISQKYYGTPARWRDIYNANRVTMSSPGALKIGMVLKLPRP